MESNDLTVIFITSNRVPPAWAQFHMEKLKEASAGFPMITISRVNTPQTDILDEEPQSYSNIYKQLLRGARKATTPYIAMAEDDTLYTREHFIQFRPNENEFAYNRNRWTIFTWGHPLYSIKDRISNCSLIAPTALTVMALEERFSKYPIETPVTGELGKSRTEKALGVTVRNRVEFYSETPIVQFNHDFGTDRSQIRHTKKHGEMQAYDIPVWRKAKHLVQHFK